MTDFWGFHLSEQPLCRSHMGVEGPGAGAGTFAVPGVQRVLQCPGAAVPLYPSTPVPQRRTGCCWEVRLGMQSQG